MSRAAIIFILGLVVGAALAYFLTAEPRPIIVEGQGLIDSTKAELLKLELKYYQLRADSVKFSDSIGHISTQLRDQHKIVVQLKQKENVYKAKIRGLSDSGLDSVLRVYFPVPDSIHYAR